MLICTFCGKNCKNENSLRNHVRTCKLNPNRQPTWLEQNRSSITVWNKGLSKETDDRIAQHANMVSATVSQKVKEGVHKGYTSEQWTKERRREKSEEKRQYFIKFPEKHPNRILAGNRKTMSYPERVAYEYLTELGIEFEHQKWIIGFYPDFVIGNLIIEIDGERWHDAEKDAIRDKKLNEAGYFVFRIKSTEKIQERIKEIISV